MSADPQLIDYITKVRAAGQPDSQTKEALLKNGWLENEIAEAFAATGGAKSPEPAQPQAVTQPAQQPVVQQQPAQPQVQPAQPSQPSVQSNPLAGMSFEDGPQQKQPEPAMQQAQPARVAQVSGQPAVNVRPMDAMQAKMSQQLGQDIKNRRRGGSFVAKFLLIIIALALLAGGGYFILQKTGLLNKAMDYINKKSAAETKSKTGDMPISASNKDRIGFVKYKSEKTPFKPAVPDAKVALAELTNLSSFEKAQKIVFSAAQKNALASTNFFVARNFDKFYETNPEAGVDRNDDWTGLYKLIGGSYFPSERQPENSVFITSDFVLHAYHKLLSNQFSYIEESSFYPALSELSKSMLAASAKEYAAAKGQKQKESYDRISAYFLVPSAILEISTEDYAAFKGNGFAEDKPSDTKASAQQKAESLAKANGVSGNALNIAKAEINLIFDANTAISSPLMGKFQPSYFEDYTQFGPRSHYARNPMLRNYFRSMMWYGRMNFLLKSPELTRDAANINLLLSSADYKKWQSIYQPTVFFVGQADDLVIDDYSAAIKKIGFLDSGENDEAVLKLQNELETYKNPQVMSSVIIDPSVFDTSKEDLQNTTKGFRFMGQRFTPDAFIFSTLTQGDEKPDPKTGQRLPSTPTALMVSTLMGSPTSSPLLDKWIKANSPQSDKIIADRVASLKDYFAKVTEAQWTQNIYWSWLYTIKSLFIEGLNKTGYPAFVKNEEWNKKNLQTFLGSWTELKHDTLLYAKQSYAEAGAGGPEKKENPIVKGYVEPNIEFFDRLIALAKMTKDGLKQFGILPEGEEANSDEFISEAIFYRKIAVAELQNEKISDDDFERLRLSAGRLDSILRIPDSPLVIEKNSRSAIIADVHTDVKMGKILYEADGIPNYVYVAVKDANGARLTKGLVYSYYEFTAPLDKRLTDQDWQKSNYSASIKNLKLPDWSAELVK